MKKVQEMVSKTVGKLVTGFWEQPVIISVSSTLGGRAVLFRRAEIYDDYRTHVDIAVSIKEIDNAKSVDSFAEYIAGEMIHRSIAKRRKNGQSGS